ncbi:MAG: tetratricopeptide repeat protein [Planctomycetes bacterium]|nr:tetratricopeptide repeat protein [Planctomycetota bacterium]
MSHEFRCECGDVFEFDGDNAHGSTYCRSCGRLQPSIENGSATAVSIYGSSSSAVAIPKAPFPLRKQTTQRQTPPQFADAEIGQAHVHSLACPNCNRAANIPRGFQGRKVRCPGCQQRFRVADDLSRLTPQPSPPTMPNSVHPPRAPSSIQASGAPRLKRSVARRPSLPVPSPPVPSPPALSPLVKAEPQRSLSARRWLWAAWGVSSLAVALLAYSLLSPYLTEIAADNEATNDAADRSVAPRVAAAQQNPPNAQPAKGDPPRPARAKNGAQDGDRWVQIDKFDPKKLIGLNPRLPQAALARNATLKGESLTLLSALQQLAIRHRVPMVIDSESLTNEGISVKEPVAVRFSDVPLADGLQKLLSPKLLTSVVLPNGSKAILITTRIKAESNDFNAKLAARLTGQSKTPASKLPADPPMEAIGVIIRRGKRLLDQRKLDAAIREFSRVLERDRQHIAALEGRGNAYFQLKQYQKAVADFSAVIRIDPKNIAAYTSRGSSYQRLGALKKSRSDRRMAARLKKRMKK